MQPLRSGRTTAAPQSGGGHSDIASSENLGMHLASLPLAAAIAVLALSSPLAAADPGAAKPAEPAQYRDADQARPQADGERQAQPAPRRRPSPPVAGQSSRGPAFKGECVWVGKRIVNLLSRDDAMAANDFMPFYAQFGCPGDHLAKAVGCVVTNSEPSENEALADRIDACWDDPKAVLAQEPTPAESALGDEQPKERPAPPAR